VRGAPERIGERGASGQRQGGDRRARDLRHDVPPARLARREQRELEKLVVTLRRAHAERDRFRRRSLRELLLATEVREAEVPLDLAAPLVRKELVREERMH
jgi:hypothetical protein